MRRVALAALLAGVAALAVHAAAPPKVWDDRPCEAEVQDLVLLADSRPVLLRLRIRVDGKPLLGAWADFLGAVFAAADADGNGELSEAEAVYLPHAGLFSGRIFLNVIGLPSRRRPGEKFTLGQLEGFYRARGMAPLQFDPDGSDGGGPSASALDRRLFELLDTNGDGKLARAELAAAPKLLAKLDADDDEVLTEAELMGRSGAPAVPKDEVEERIFDGTSESPFFYILNPGKTGRPLADRLLTRYGAGEKSLTRVQLGLSPGEFAALDADHDGRLDVGELAHFAYRPADLELGLRLTRGAKLALEVLAPDGRRSALAGNVKSFRDGLSVETADVWLELVGTPADRMPRAVFDKKAQYTAWFTRVDKDGNGYLDEAEVNKSSFRGVSTAIDRDGDGKVTLKEVLAYADQEARLRRLSEAAGVTLSVTDLGRGLMLLMDADGDGRLGVRELRYAVKLLGAYDRNRDGQLDLTEIPRRYRVECRPGRTINYVMRNGVGTPAQRRADERAPLWFRKMDLNGDGDVSRREFLGSDEEFARLDADGDGLISPEESLAAEKSRRRE